jgi:hypothetical protein
MRVGIGARGVGNVVTTPVLHGVASDGEGGHGLMIKEEAIISFVMAPEENGGFNPNEWAIENGILTIKRRREDRKAGSFRRGKQGDPVWAAAKIGGLGDEALRILQGRVDEGISEVVEVAKVGEGHVDRDIVRSLGSREARVFQVV